MRSVDRQRGDTLVEVMLAIAITAIVVVMVMTLMNAGLASLQGSVERSQVRSAMQGQIAALQYIRDDYMDNTGAGVTGSAWSDIINPAVYLNTGSPASISDTGLCTPNVPKAFYVDMPLSPAAPTDAIKAKPYVAGPAVSVAQPGKQMWIESYPGGAVSPGPGIPIPGAVFVVVRACWDSPGGGVVQYETTVMRLHDGT